MFVFSDVVCKTDLELIVVSDTYFSAFNLSKFIVADMSYLLVSCLFVFPMILYFINFALLNSIYIDGLCYFVFIEFPSSLAACSTDKSRCSRYLYLVTICEKGRRIIKLCMQLSANLRARVI